MEWRGGQVHLHLGAAGTTQRETKRRGRGHPGAGRWPSQASIRKRRPFGARQDPRQTTGSEWVGLGFAVVGDLQGLGCWVASAVGERRGPRWLGRNDPVPLECHPWPHQPDRAKDRT